jgi:hypothetical protein
MANNHEGALAAHTLTLHRLRELESGYSTHGADERVANSLIDLRFFMKGNFDFDSGIDHAPRLGVQERF